MNFENFLNETPTSTPILKFIFNLILSFIFSSILSKIYNIYGRSLSNRKEFSRIFTTLSMATMLIITIVKSSLSLSLGLVGALSIVRFRTAIKEPEELSYAFLSIAIGIGYGANQVVITSLGIIIIIISIIVKSKLVKENNLHLLNLVISSQEKLDIEKIIEIVSDKSKMVRLKRLTEFEGNNESCLSISVINFQNLVLIREKLIKLNPKINISFLDESGLIDY